MIELDECPRCRELKRVTQGCVDLFELWRDGIFARLGIHWTEEPPALKKARAALRGTDRRA